MTNTKFFIFIIVSLFSLAIALFIAYFIFTNNSSLQEKKILYGFVWSVFCFSFSIFFYGILNTIAEVRGKKFNVNFSVRGAGAFLIILLFGGLLFISKINDPQKPPINKDKTNKDTSIITPDSNAKILQHPIDKRVTENKSKNITTTVGIEPSKIPDPQPNDSINSSISGQIYLTDTSFLIGANIIVEPGAFQTKTDSMGRFKLNVRHYKNISKLEITCIKNKKKIELEDNSIATEEQSKIFKVK